MPEKGIGPTINLAISPKPVANPQSADHDDTRLGNKGSGINSVLSPRFTIRNSNGGQAPGLPPTYWLLFD